MWLEPTSLYHELVNNYHRIRDAVARENIHVLAFSMYVWNRDLVFEISKKLKREFPRLIIVIGGPDVDAHRDTKFFHKHPYIDWAIYGDGEEAFSRLLDHLSGKQAELINIVNSGHVYEHKVFLDKTAMRLSPYITYKDEIMRFIGGIETMLSSIYKQVGQLHKIMIVWETTKGCPYACSFCDWSSGLHNKVRIWGKDELIPNWKKEIDWFFEIYTANNMHIYWTNPNIGLAHQDEEIVDYWCSLKDNRPGPMIYNPQLSKLKKETTFRLLDKMITSNVTQFFKFDLQDLDPLVLENINRPEIPWEEHKRLILAIKAKHKNKKFKANRYSNRLTFIWGLPGQTLAHMKTNMIEAGTVESFAAHLPFELLPNSPAANPDYIDKFKLNISSISIVEHGEAFGMTAPDKSNRTIHRAVTSTYSLSERDWFTGMVLFSIYNVMFKDYDLYGREGLLFDNYHKISDVINLGYANFQTTKTIEVIQHSKRLSIYQFVMENSEHLYEMLYK